MGKRPLILLVDDEVDILMLLRHFFNESGFDVVTATGGNEAYELFKTHSVDAIVSDMRMDSGTGLELLQKIKSHESLKPFFFFYSSETKYSDRELISLGAHGIFRKPCNMKKVVNRLKEYLFVRQERFILDSYEEILPDISAEVKLESKSNSCELLNVSDQGMCVLIEGLDCPTVGQKIEIKLKLEDDRAKDIETTGEVRWVKKDDEKGVKVGVKINEVKKKKDWSQFIDVMRYEKK